MFKECLSNENWECLFNCQNKDANILYFQFIEKVKGYFNNCFPLTCIRQKIFKDNRWMTQGLRISAIMKRKLHKESKISKDPEFKKYVTNYKRIFKKCVRLAKVTHYSLMIIKSDNSTKTAWKIVKRKLE